METLKGHIDHIIYYNEERGWGIARLSYGKKDEIIIKGTFSLLEGDYVECTGEYIDDKKWGKQFKLKEIQKIQPESKDDIIKYLSSGIFSGIGKKTAEQIYLSFGDKIFDKMDEDINELLQIPGITEKKIKLIKLQWEEQKRVKDIVLFLRKFNLSFNLINKLIDLYGDNTISKIEKDPYLLIDHVEGIGFKTADRIALSIGLKKDSIERILAGIFYTLRLMLNEGHCFLNKKDLITLVMHQLEIKDSNEIIEECLIVLIEKGHLHEDDNKIFLKTTYVAEKGVSEFILKKRLEEGFNLKDVSGMIETEVSVNDLTLSEEQKKAVTEIIESPISILTGGAGVGKTTTVKLLLKLLENLGKDIILATPTGRAAQRMNEVSGYSVKTIHRLLQWDFEEKGFVINETNPLKGDFLIIDEVSMVDIFLMNSLCKSVPKGMQVLLIGDTEQLPSVGPGTVLKNIIDSKKVIVKELTQIFRQAESSDIVNISHSIRNGETPYIDKLADLKDYTSRDCILVESINVNKDEVEFINKYRSIISNQRRGKKKNVLGNGWRNLSLKKKDLLSRSEIDKVNDIVKDFDVNHSQVQLGFSLEEYLEKFVTKMVPHIVDPDSEIQILCPMKKGIMGTKNINKILQRKINPEDSFKEEIVFGENIFRVGDRVIQTKNDYERNVFNGDIGYIVDIKKGNLIIEYKTDILKKVVYERKDLENLELAYAITIHKSQGSEFDIVIIPIFNEHHIMLYRQLIYTAITRGKKYVSLFGEESAVKKAVRNKDNSVRNTFLKERLLESDIEK